MDNSNLTVCAECGHNVSKNAKKCPKCGITNFSTATCFFCKKRSAISDLVSKNVKKFIRYEIFGPKMTRGLTHTSGKKRFFHRSCIKKYLGPNKKEIIARCSDCGKNLKLEAEVVFKSKEKDPCPNCGAPNQPPLPNYYSNSVNVKQCDICNHRLYPKFQSISKHSFRDHTDVYHTICAFKAGVGIFDLRRGRNLIFIGILIVLITSLF
jgi:predicted RNA-binding Zn-ribbon protein involved in translation (DUF1610 family)